MTGIFYFFTAIGVLATGLVMTGLYLDFSSFDQTSGGYEAPYSGVSGDPVDWFSMDRALLVHKPREAFIALGFQPEF